MQTYCWLTASGLIRVHDAQADLILFAWCISHNTMWCDTWYTFWWLVGIFFAWCSLCDVMWELFSKCSICDAMWEHCLMLLMRCHMETLHDAACIMAWYDMHVFTANLQTVDFLRLVRAFQCAYQIFILTKFAHLKIRHSFEAKSIDIFFTSYWKYNLWVS